ncbi:MAG TPA: FecR domain-containing protein [Rhizomicrobium sp.]|nr:FecR domain-containing protein [Rhizomicrobium sp.]
MSNAELEAAGGSAQQVEADAAAWLRRRHFGEWTQDDQASLDQWRGAALAHEVAYLRLEAAWDRTERLTALHPFKVEQPVAEARNWRLPLSLAAGLAAIALLTTTALPVVRHSGSAVYSTPVGGREIIKLADGSRIELNTATVLRLSADQRGAVLERGEAYFQIKHDAAHPFTLAVAGKLVIDLGT